MDFEIRLIGTYGILLVGSQIVYLGMKFTGSASPRNPFWLMVDWFHSVITYGSLAAAGIFIFAQYLVPLALTLMDEVSKYLQKPKETKQHSEHFEKDSEEHERHLEEQRRIEAKKKEYKELRKQMIIEEVKSLTAEEVTHSALDDFL